ncbi:Di-sulfide bridge nucleocytoplasmic transport domain-containing protein [Mucor lusitanicus]|uniref:Di-sulfide bridge nucleocytoplasmic transport domain-containing protein n=1 Tax=Mucor circinelloides f. lusitanicus TaxID=29924 RepID=A0A8H4BE77_MUCCL|nr:Di-sulfide bridge nucleocytoplasmic transport domain-containing protein [Mucor lusitanicus]
MVYSYDPMDIDGVCYSNENEFLSEDDEMDIVHEPVIKPVESPLISPLFQHNYKKSVEICNSFSNLFGNVSIHDAKNKVPDDDATQDKLVTSQTPPLSPERQCLSMSRIENPTVDGLNTAVTLRTSSGMNTPPAHESAVSATGNHYSSSYHYSPAPNYHATHNPTFVYHAAPPVDASHGRVVYMFGIFKIACYSVMFFSCMYVGYHVVSNLHHDMVSKIESYESDLLTDQLYCREQYDANLCGPATRLPAVKNLCRGWEQCMMRPSSVGKTKVMAEIMGDAANGFSEVLSLRTMIYSLCIVYGFMWSFTHIIKAYSSPESQPSRPPSPNNSPAIDKSRYPLLE